MPINKPARYGLQNTTATVDEQHPNMCGIPLLAIIPASACCGSRDFFRSSASGLRDAGASGRFQVEMEEWPGMPLGSLVPVSVREGSFDEGGDYRQA